MQRTTFKAACAKAAVVGAALVLSALASGVAHAQQKANIPVILGDDVGWFNVGAYHQGIMSGKTPNLDRLASSA